MTELEIIANQAIEEDIIGVFELYGYGENFTVFSPVYGRGRHGRREGSAIWPEVNVLFKLFVEDEEAEPLLAELEKVKLKFSGEGLRCYSRTGLERNL